MTIRELFSFFLILIGFLLIFTNIILWIPGNMIYAMDLIGVPVDKSFSYALLVGNVLNFIIGIYLIRNTKQTINHLGFLKSFDDTDKLIGKNLEFRTLLKLGVILSATTVLFMSIPELIYNAFVYFNDIIEGEQKKLEYGIVQASISCAFSYLILVNLEFVLNFLHKQDLIDD